MYINGTSAATATASNYIAEFAVRDFTSGDVVSVSGSNVGDSFTISGITNKHDYVEIGGIKWATMNIGANSVTDAGLYFQWGDTQGYTAAQVGSGEGQKYFGWADYKYGNGTSSPGDTGMTKYNSTDGKMVLDASDDAVAAAWGGAWRMPTTEEFVALGNAVNTEWTADYQGSGIAGLVFTAKDGSGAELFFPAAGICSYGSAGLVGSGGLYWSGSLYSSSMQLAYYLYFGNGSVGWQGFNDRYYGFPVRGVVG
jgi:hypothetical protein